MFDQELGTLLCLNRDNVEEVLEGLMTGLINHCARNNLNLSEVAGVLHLVSSQMDKPIQPKAEIVHIEGNVYRIQCNNQQENE